MIDPFCNILALPFLRTVGDLIIVAAVFGLVLTVWLCGVLVVHMRRAAKASKMERRLISTGADGTLGEMEESRLVRLWHEGKEKTTLGAASAFSSVIDCVPPDKIMPWGAKSLIACSLMVKGWSSQYTTISLTRRAMS